MRKLIKAFKICLNIFIHPSFIKVLIQNAFHVLHQAYPDNRHLDEAMTWLKNSQNAVTGGGSSGIYNFESGWNSPYPETTGYIIPTFLTYFDLTKDEDFLLRARRMGDWEIEIQLPSGAIRGGVGLNKYPIVFNTGQVIFGWIALYRATNEVKYLEAATKAADWLTEIQDEDGKWSRFTYNSIPHSYNVRVAWALMEIATETNRDRYMSSALRKVEWVLSKASSDGWIDHMGFHEEEFPWTHTIAYTLRGLLECSHFLTGEIKARIISTVSFASEKIIDKYQSVPTKTGVGKFLPGTFNREWKTDANYSCLTGNAQLSIVFLKLYLLNKKPHFYEAAYKLIEELKSTQDLSSRNKGIRGGIAGSYPIWGKYVNFGYPNWAAKFFAEALMLKAEIDYKDSL